MGLDINEARRHGEAIGIDNFFRIARERWAERSDPAGGESDITNGA